MKRIALIIAIAAATIMLGGCTMTENTTEQTGSSWSAHIEFEF